MAKNTYSFAKRQKEIEKQKKREEKLKKKEAKKKALLEGEDGEMQEEAIDDSEE